MNILKSINIKLILSTPNSVELL